MGAAALLDLRMFLMIEGEPSVSKVPNIFKLHLSSSSALAISFHLVLSESFSGYHSHCEIRSGHKSQPHFFIPYVLEHSDAFRCFRLFWIIFNTKQSWQSTSKCIIQFLGCQLQCRGIIGKGRPQRGHSDKAANVSADPA